MLTNRIKLILLSFYFWPLFVYGQQIQCEKTFTLGLGNIWPPYYFEEKGQARGIDIEIVEHIFSQSDYCLHFIKMPSSARALVELKKGTIDFLYGASFSDERAEYAIFSKPYRHETIRLFWRKDEHNEYKNASLFDLFAAKLQVATNRGSHTGGYGIALTEKENQPYITHVPTIERRMKMLALRRVDFTIEDEIAGLFYLQNQLSKSIEMHPYIINQNNISLLFSKKNTSAQEVTIFNNIIKNNQEKFEILLMSYQ